MRTRMTAAAAALRFPYWDWARDGNVVPRSMVSRTFTVTTPNGTRSIDNPLYSYRFHPIDQRLFYSPVCYVVAASLLIRLLCVLGRASLTTLDSFNSSPAGRKPSETQRLTFSLMRAQTLRHWSEISIAFDLA